MGWYNDWSGSVGGYNDCLRFVGAYYDCSGLVSGGFSVIVIFGKREIGSSYSNSGPVHFRTNAL